MCHFPKMAIQVFEVAAVTAPENFLWLLNQSCSSRDGLRNYCINFLCRGDVVSQCKCIEAITLRRNAGIFGECLPAI